MVIVVVVVVVGVVVVAVAADVVVVDDVVVVVVVVVVSSKKLSNYFPGLIHEPVPENKNLNKITFSFLHTLSSLPNIVTK